MFNSLGTETLNASNTKAWATIKIPDALHDDIPGASQDERVPVASYVGSGACDVNKAKTRTTLDDTKAQSARTFTLKQQYQEREKQQDRNYRGQGLTTTAATILIATPEADVQPAP